MAMSRLESGVVGTKQMMQIWTLDLQNYSFSFLHSDFTIEKVADETAIAAFSDENFFAFNYKPDISSDLIKEGWYIASEQNIIDDYKRLGIPNSNWKISDMNMNYEVYIF